MQALTAHSGNSTTSSAVPSSTAAASSTTSTFAAATPTYIPLSDCPASNDTSYTSSFAQSSSSSSSGLSFSKYCGFAGPLSRSNAYKMAEAFVYSFSDCIEVCAGLNYYSADSNCTVAVYQPSGSRPGNCWVGSASDATVSSLSVQQGTDVALLKQLSL